MSGLLSGIRVLDLSRVLAGPFATMTLGDLGAEIIKVERIGKGDDLRTWGPPFTPEGESVYFVAVNRNKRSVTIDIQQPAGQLLVRELAAQSDVLVENFRPGTMERLGLGFDDLAKQNPGLIYCSLSGFGTSGPYRDLPAYDVILQAMGGLMSVTGYPDGPPVRSGIAVVDVVAGLYIAVGVLAALTSRAQNGVGQRLELSLLGAGLAAIVNIAATYLMTGQVPGRLGNAHPNVAPYEAFETSDGYVCVAVATEEQWARFCAALNMPQLATDVRYLTNQARLANRQSLTEALMMVFREDSTTLWVDRLRSFDVPCAPVNTVDHVLEDPHIREDMIREIMTPNGALRVIDNPLRFSQSSTESYRPSPHLGEDTDDVLSKTLGRSSEEIARLRVGGVI